MLKNRHLLDSELRILINKFESQPKNETLAIKLCYELNLRALHELCVEFASDAARYHKQSCDLEFERILAICLNEHHELDSLCSLLENDFEAGNTTLKLRRNLALIYFYLERDEEAFELLEEIEEDTPASIDSRTFEVLAQIYHAREDFDKCLDLCDRAINAPGPSARVVRLKGLCHLEQLDYNSARSCFELALDLEPQFVWACHSLGELLFEQEHYAEAFRFFGKAIFINPVDPGNYFLLAEAFMDADMDDLAIAELNKCLMLDMDTRIQAEVYNALGYLYMRKGVFAISKKYLKHALKLEPQLAVVYYNLGRLAAKQNQYAAAEKHYKRALAFDDDQFGAWLELGFISVHQKKSTPLVKKYFETAVNLEPEDPEPWIGLSKYYRLVGDCEEQLQAALKAFELDSTNGSICNTLGIAYECCGMELDAIEAYREGLSQDPDNRKAANNLAYLYEKFMEKEPEKEKYWKALAIDAWGRRYAICHRTGKSVVGALNHLLALGLTREEINEMKREL